MNEKRKWLIGCSVLLVLFFLGAAGILLAARFITPSVRAQIPLGGSKIAVVRVEDVIYSSEKVVDKIMELKEESTIKALVLRINSPGGGVAPSQEIYEAVRSFRESGKPVVASLGAVAASGGYYIACAADTIMANPGTVTGSIGVIFEFPYIAELLKKIGVDMEVIKSGKYKDAGSPNRKLTPEERALFQGVINDTWEQFVAVVADGRGMEEKDVKAIADGRIFTGRQALDAGLVDTLGTFEDAKLLAKEMAGLSSDAGVFEHEKARRFLDLLLGDTEELLRLKGRLMPAGVNFLFVRE
jgi:protease-4